MAASTFGEFASSSSSSSSGGDIQNWHQRWRHQICHHFIFDIFYILRFNSDDSTCRVEPLWANLCNESIFLETHCAPLHLGVWFIRRIDVSLWDISSSPSHLTLLLAGILSTGGGGGGGLVDTVLDTVAGLIAGATLPNQSNNGKTLDKHDRKGASWCCPSFVFMLLHFCCCALSKWLSLNQPTTHCFF